MNLFKNQKGMNIIGQGGKIILFMLPSLLAVLLVHTYFPRIAALPENLDFIKPLGYVLLILGIILWVSALIQLLAGFSKGKLITIGAYGIVRNPIYSSAIFFLFPAVSLLTLTWVYFVPSAFLYVGVLIFLGMEERQLTEVFGKKYEDYTARVDRLIPFMKSLNNRKGSSQK
jgi:protein-S-isoprenylcysteine O-methyltransferase Ste14